MCAAHDHRHQGLAADQDPAVTVPEDQPVPGTRPPTAPEPEAQPEPEPEPAPEPAPEAAPEDA
jgi:hypothetical protein